MQSLKICYQRAGHKFMITLMAATILGMGIGIGQVKAEYLYNVYVEGAGNVAIAGTNGRYVQVNVGGVLSNELHTNGVSTSNQTLAYLYAQNRIWHQSTGGTILQGSQSRTWNNNTGGATNEVVSVAIGDKGVTMSIFNKGSPWHSTTRYTSYPDNTASCANYFNNGNNC